MAAHNMFAPRVFPDTAPTCNGPVNSGVNNDSGGSERLPSDSERVRAFYYHFVMGGPAASPMANEKSTTVAEPAMQFREIVGESFGVAKKLGCRLVPFLVAFYMPLVVIYCLYIWGFTLTYLDHEDMAWAAVDYIVALSKDRTDEAEYFRLPPNSEALTIIRLLIKVVVLITFILCYYLATTSTIMLIFSNHQTDEKSRWSLKSIFTMLPNRFWRVAATDFWKISILAGMFGLQMLLTTALQYMARVINADVVERFIIMERFILFLWSVYFLRNVTFTSQVAAVERAWGFAAMKSSNTLLIGKKMTTLTLMIFQVVCSYLVYIVQTALLLCPTWTKGIGFAIHIAIVTTWLILLTTMTTVYYLSCTNKPKEQVIYDPPSFALWHTESQARVPLWRRFLSSISSS